MSMIRSCLNVLIAFLLIAMSAADDECVAIETMVPSSTQPKLPEAPCDPPKLAPASPKYVIPMEELASSYDPKDAPFPFAGRVASMDAPPSSLSQGPALPLQAISPEPAAISYPATATAPCDADVLSSVPAATRLQIPVSSPGFSKRASPPVSDTIFVQSRQYPSAKQTPLKHGSLITNGVQTVPTGRAITRRKMKKVPVNVAVYVKVPENSRLRDVPSAGYDKVYGKIGPLIANGNNPAFADQQYSVPTLKADNRQQLSDISTVNPANVKSNFPSVVTGQEITNNNLIDYRATSNVNNLKSNFPSIVNGAETTNNNLNDYRNANTESIVRDNTDVKNNFDVKNNVDNNIDLNKNTITSVDQRNTNNNVAVNNNNFENKANTVNNDLRNSNIIDNRVNTNEMNSNSLNSNSDVTNIASNTVNKNDINVNNDVVNKNSDIRQTSDVKDINVSNTVDNAANVNSNVNDLISTSQGSNNVNDVNVNNNTTSTKNVTDVNVSNSTTSITNINGVSSNVVGSDNNAKNVNNFENFDSAAHFQSSNVINGATNNGIRQDTGANSPKKQQLQQSNMIHSMASTIINMKQDQSNSVSDGQSGSSMIPSQADAIPKSVSPGSQSRTESQHMHVDRKTATISHN